MSSVKCQVNSYLNGASLTCYVKENPFATPGELEREFGNAYKEYNGGINDIRKAAGVRIAPKGKVETFVKRAAKLVDHSSVELSEVNIGKHSKKEEREIMTGDYKHWTEHNFFDGFETYIKQHYTRYPLDRERRQASLKRVFEKHLIQYKQDE